MTRFFLRLLAFSLLFILGLHQIALAAPKKYAAVVVDSSTGRVLHAENAHERRHPASLTKKMTLYLIFEALRSKKISLKTERIFLRSSFSRGTEESVSYIFCTQFLSIFSSLYTGFSL